MSLERVPMIVELWWLESVWLSNCLGKSNNSLAGKSPVAVNTFVGLVTGVDLTMTLQMFKPGEALTASIAPQLSVKTRCCRSRSVRHVWEVAS